MDVGKKKKDFVNLIHRARQSQSLYHFETYHTTKGNPYLTLPSGQNPEAG